ncbi:MAG TPA: hypothetical protein VHE81_07190 [Lacipirellulaceae bacterium]|nr:hypothetical protein [Lacipirellulaceae bacterium]
MRRPIALGLLLVAAFCVYGFVASWEPGVRGVYFRFGYPVAAVLCGAVAMVLLLRQRKKS